jgi:hypothetical protein
MAVPELELFKPYQISISEWLSPKTPRAQVTPPPLTSLTLTLLLAENNTSALPGWGALFSVTITPAAEL